MGSLDSESNVFNSVTDLTNVRRDPVCEHELKLAIDSIRTQEAVIDQKNREMQNFLRQIRELSRTINGQQAEIDKLKSQIDEYSHMAYIKTTFLWFLAAIVCVKFIWWFLPISYRLAKKMIRAISAYIRRVRETPARFRSSVSAHFGNFEDIEMEPLIRAAPQAPVVQAEPQAPAANVPAPPADPPQVAGRLEVQEAILPNSPLNRVMKYDQCIFKIYIIDSDYPDQIHFNGMGFWCNAGETKIVQGSRGYFLTAYHVLPATGEIMLRSANDESKYFKMPVSEWTLLEGFDLAYYEPPQNITTKLCLRKAKVPQNTLRGSEVATVYGRDQTSMGIITSMEDSFNLRYAGSTYKGFSGSPYITGKTAYGIHTGSTQETGFGIDLALVSMKLAHMNKLSLESSDEFVFNELLKDIRGKRKLDIRRAGLDDVIINVGGRDFFYDDDEFNQMIRRAKNDYGVDVDFQRESVIFSPGPRLIAKKTNDKILKEAYSDIDGLPKNCQGPAPALVTGAGAVSAAQTQLNPKLSKLSSLTDKTTLTVGLPSIAVPSKEAFDCMLESMSVQSKEIKNLTRQIGNLLSKMYADAAKENGQQPQKLQKRE